MYKNIIFDVGEVLFSYGWKEALMLAGASYEDALILGKNLFDDPVWGELDLGVRPYWEVVDELSSKYPPFKAVITQFLTNVEVMPKSRPVIWELVKQLKGKGYKLYLLSNYSEYMFSRHTAGRPFMDEIDGAIVSYMVNINKPDRGIYEALLNKYNLNASECLFFDDKLENVEGARACGIDAIQVLDEPMLAGELIKLIRG